jgi:hypothetical protein
MNVSFYYDSSENCDLSLSEEIPQDINEVPCTHICQDDGMFLNISSNY